MTLNRNTTLVPDRLLSVSCRSLICRVQPVSYFSFMIFIRFLRLLRPTDRCVDLLSFRSCSDRLMPIPLSSMLHEMAPAKCENRMVRCFSPVLYISPCQI